MSTKGQYALLSRLVPMERSIRLRVEGWSSLARWFKRGIAFVVLGAVILSATCALGWALWSSQAPIIGEHDWRQGWTYSMAYNYAFEDAAILYPEHDWTEDRTGIIGTEPPVYALALGGLMAAFGPHPQVGRLFSLLLFLIASAAFARMLFRRHGAAAAWSFGLVAACSPLVLGEFRQVQPDPVATSLSMLAVCVALHASRTKKLKHHALGLALITLAVLVKPIALGVLPGYWLATVRWRKNAIARLFASGLVLVVPLALYLVWQRWAVHLTETYDAGTYRISIETDPDEMSRNLRNGSAWKFLLLRLMPFYVLVWAFAPAAIVGIVTSWRSAQRHEWMSITTWLTVTILMLGAFSSRLWSNWYYCIPLFPPLAYFAAHGLASAWRLVRGVSRDRLERFFGLLVIASLALGGPLALASDWGNLGSGPLGIWQNSAVFTRLTSPRIAVGLVMVCGGIAFASRWFARLPRHVSILLLPLALWAAYFAGNDALHSARVRSAEPLWMSSESMIAECRAAVDRVSSREDRFLVTAFNPAWLQRIRRRGYADARSVTSRRSVEYYRSHGVRFVVHFSDGEAAPGWLGRLTPSDRGRGWQLYSLDPAPEP